MSDDFQIKYEYNLDVFDRFSFLIIAPLSAICSSVMLLAHVLSQELRKQPGDLIIAISIFELVMPVYYFTLAYITIFRDSDIPDGGALCTFGSRIVVFAQSGDFLYNICFLIHIAFTLKSSIQKGFVPKKLYHISAFIGICSGYMYVERNNQFGKDIYGICSMKKNMKEDGRPEDSSQLLLLIAVALLVGVILAAYLLINAEKKLPNFGEDILYMKRDFLQYYKSYIKTCLSYWLICFAGYCAQFLDVEISSFSDTSLVGMLDDCAKVTSTVKLMLPCLFFLVRIQDPLIRKKIWKPFQQMHIFSASQSTASKEDSLQGPIRKVPNSEKSFEELRSSISNDDEDKEVLDFAAAEEDRKLDVQDLDPDADDLMWMNLLPAKIKESYTRTFLACIYCKYEEKLDQKAGLVCTGLKDSQDICYYTIKGSKRDHRLQLQKDQHQRIAGHFQKRREDQESRRKRRRSVW